MKLSEKLEYCKVCRNKAFSIKTGIYCNLTGEKPTFDSTCQTFQEDEILRQEQEKSFYSKIGEDYYFYPTSINKIKKEISSLPDKFYVFKSKFLSIFFILQPLFLLIIVWYEYYDNASQQRILLILLCSFPQFILFFYGIKGYKDNKPRLVIDIEGLEIKEMELFIPWGIIIGILLQTDDTWPKGKATTVLKIKILGQQEEVSIEIEDFKIGESKLITILEAYRLKSRIILSNKKDKKAQHNL